MIPVVLIECNVGCTLFVDSNVYDVEVCVFRAFVLDKCGILPEAFYGSIDMIMFLPSLSIVICCFKWIVLYVFLKHLYSWHKVNLNSTSV